MQENNQLSMAVEMAHKELLKLNLGCGLNAPSGWINIDASFAARLSKVLLAYRFLCRIINREPIPWQKNIKVMDVRKGLPFPNDSCEYIFSSHMLEHMTYEDANFVIKECHRFLVSGGVIRIIGPDLYQIAKRYIWLLSTDPKGEHCHKFLKDLNMQSESYKGF